MDEPVTFEYIGGNPELSGHLVGRATDLMLHEREVRALCTGMDFRDVQYRREVFIRFYLFHLMYRAHPGCVYYLMPYLAEQLNWTIEDRLWFAFINGCTQHPVTSLIIFRRFPNPYDMHVHLDDLRNWFNENWTVLPFDTDRRYQKKEFVEAVRRYRMWLSGRDQIEAFREALPYNWEWDYSDTGGFRFADGRRAAMNMGHVHYEYREGNFDALWKLIQSPSFWGFGRLAAWSYLEYLFVNGLPLEPSSMMLRDMDGSKSHRNGLVKVLGRDDLDWHKESPFPGKYSKQVLEWLDREADTLLQEVRERAEDWNFRANYPQIDLQHVSRFTFESALCTFKGWFRKDRRYANVYNDMLCDRIIDVQTKWPDEDLRIFWRARREYLPEWARVEDCPTDPGLKKPKQNHFRLTGRVPMMGNVWGVFRDYDETWRTTP